MVGQPGRTVLIALREGLAVGTVDCIVVPNLTRADVGPYFVGES
jgi:hypothetical protein